jgi:hypothetical protein
MAVSWRIVKETLFLLRRQLLHYLLAEEKSEEKGKQLREVLCSEAIQKRWLQIEGKASCAILSSFLGRLH